MEELIRSTSPEGIFIYSTHPVPPLKDVPSLLKQSDPTPVREVADFGVLKQMLREVSYGCVVFDVKEVSHLKELVEISHSMRAEISSGIFQFIVLCQLEHPKLEAILDKLNCNKVLYPPYSAKGLKIALTRHMAIARKSTSKEDSESQEVKISGSTSGRRPSQQKRNREVREVDPLNTSDDCWLTKISIARSIHGKWLCFAIGPGPVTGTWNEIRNEGASRRFDDRLWEWCPRDPEKDLFIREGVWRFRGRFPEFKDTSWTFVGAAPELAYYQNGERKERKIFSESNGDLVIAKNSQVALEKLPDIQASIDFEVYLKRGGGKGSLIEYVEKRRSERELSASVQGVEAKELELQLEKELERASKDYIAKEEIKANLEVKDTQEKPAEKPFGEGKFGKKSVDPSKLVVFKKAETLFKSRSRLFQLVPTENEKKTYILDACRSQCPVTLWTARRQIKEISIVLSAQEGGEGICIAYPKHYKKNEMEGEISKHGANRLYLNINSRRTAIFFAQEIKEVCFFEGHITVPIPSTVYEVQRREFLRYPVPAESPVDVTLGLRSDHQSAIQGRARDISAGGLQLEHTLTDSKASQRARNLEVGAVFPNLSFDLYGKSIHCSAQLRWKKEIEGGSKILLGVQIVKIAPEDQEGIRLFVMEESFDYIESVLSETVSNEEVSEAAPVNN